MERNWQTSIKLNLNKGLDVELVMASISSIFILKPIIDMLHEDVLRYVKQIEELNKKVEILEDELKSSRTQKKKNEVVIDDINFADEAIANFQDDQQKTDEKVVVVNEDAKKAAKKEYQRQYRLKHKANK